MADTKREIERKYESDDSGLPDLTGVAGVADVLDKGTAELDATYYDTSDLRLAAASITLRRRTGGSDAGWHLKLPVAPGVRDEIQVPLSDTVPDELAGLVRARVREGQLVPVVRLRSTRDLRDLVDSDGRRLAEVGVDTVRAERLFGGEGTAQWTEIEVELADGEDQRVLDKVEKRLRKAGVRPSKSASKLARALAETKGGHPRPKDEPAEPVTVGDHVLAYVRAQRDAVLDLDPAVRQDAEEAVHDMRVATRRLRSTFKSFPKILDRKVTDPIGDELKWLAGELGVGRDQEVLAERLGEALDELAPTLLHGPVRDRLGTWARAEHGGARRRLLGVLDSPRYLTLLDTLDAVVADPPVLKAAAKKPDKGLAKAVRKDFAKVSALVEEAMEQPPGTDRDLGLHEARKKAKRTRYAAEAATPALGGPAKALTKSMKSLQSLLGDHQDSVMVRTTLRELSAVAHAAGENTFTYGLLYGREERRATGVEEALPGQWRTIRGAMEV
ncbi:CHAD domain-containing protein [Streptomyces turgidiscabies]|uniref:Adenylate cyclase n=1 Tax=Streptomyces turgidiscabies (strain Car8) TaxID=698760 RepID=L7FCS7_STRT8|nr:MULTISPECIES: CYTH and CHAD domain-containing protein [Streptomyces]ELP68856.1 adenylate cyclase [Streptomyces turgidiscabies Car8]MDX3497780.1 CYTH and CHAD domain-containing protein [Streptomyces turgidiscabies]GAQ68876.1 CHAD domain protein [Streptomyces turgidiscabies]